MQVCSMKDFSSAKDKSHSALLDAVLLFSMCGYRTVPAAAERTMCISFHSPSGMLREIDDRNVMGGVHYFFAFYIH